MTSDTNHFPQTVVIGSDHAGFALKEDLIAYMSESFSSISIDDVGCFTASERVDYPKYGTLIGEKVKSLTTDMPLPNVLGIAVCGSGVGISIAANKVDGIRCALCHDHYTSKMARKHNNANVLALGGRTVGIEVAKDIVNVFLSTMFEGGRHSIRVAML